MPDLFDPLRNLEQELDLLPMPPSEVRRQGDRMRRRRHALKGVGGVAAVAVIASGAMFALTALDDPSKPGPTPVAPSPQGGWLTEIPTSFALDRGYPDANPPEEQQQGPSQKFAPISDERVDPCGNLGYPSAAPIDSLGTTWKAPQDNRARELTIYADSATASAVLTTMVDSWQACANETVPDPPYEWTTQLTRNSFGDESWTAVKGSPQYPTVSIYHAVRVGNAVLVNQVYNEGMLENSPAQVAVQASQVGPLVADMCIFALVPCREAPDDGSVISPKIPLLTDDALLTTEQLDGGTARLGVTWEEIANREDPTLDCQADWLNALSAARGGFREWRAPGAEAATAVLEYPDPSLSRDAYNLIRGWVDSCEQRMPATRPLVPADPGGEIFVTTGEAYSVPFTASSSTGEWLDRQGVGLVGKRVVLLSVATQTGDARDLTRAWDKAMGEALETAHVVEVAPAAGDIPDGFPLLDGWPEDAVAENPETDGRNGPSRTMEPIYFTTCDRTFADSVPYRDRLLATWTNPEDYRTRQLTTYADADRAVRAMNELEEFWRGCETEAGSDGYTSHFAVRPTSVGGQSFALARYHTWDDYPALGVQVFNVIRVGRAVLVDTSSSEGLVEELTDIDEVAQSQISDSQTPVSAMCTFTEAGCP